MGGFNTDKNHGEMFFLQLLVIVDQKSAVDVPLLLATANKPLLFIDSTVNKIFKCPVGTWFKACAAPKRKEWVTQYICRPIIKIALPLLSDSSTIQTLDIELSPTLREVGDPTRQRI